jgi:DNA repair exonuclease SbcCD ATPase subunit
LEEALADSCDQILPDLDLLPTGVVGRAYGSVCARISPERGQKILNWISGRDQERADSERAYALRGLMDSAPTAAFRMLCSMRGSPTKEQRERLVSVLADVTAASIAQTLAGQEKEYELRKAIELLLIAGQEPKADRNMRRAILEGVAPSVRRVGLDSGSMGAQVRKGVETILATLDPNSDLHFRHLFEEQAIQQQPQDVGPRPLDAMPAEVVPGREPVFDSPPDSRGVAEPIEPVQEIHSAGVSAAKPDPLAWFDANIQMLAHAREFYLAARREAEAARAEAEAERKRREEVEARIADSAHLVETLSQMETRNRKLEDQLSETTRLRDLEKTEIAKAARDLKAERETRESRESELREAAKGFAQEQENLERRVDINAEARLRDFRIALSSALKPLLQDIPGPGSERAGELGAGLLVRIDQIAHTLAQHGIELRRSAGGER